MEQLYKPGESFVATTTSFTGNSRARVVEGESSNNFNPIYRFSTDDIVAEIGNNSVARSSIDMINVVPNPYYMVIQNMKQINWTTE